MEDIIEQLRACNQPVAVPLELPEEDLLVEIEEQLYMAIPGDMRTFLLEVSDVIYGALEPVTVADERSHTFLPEVAAQAWDQGMPRHMLPVCAYQQGYYCIDPDGKVQFWDGLDFSADDSGESEWDSIWHWAEQVWLNDSTGSH